MIRIGRILLIVVAILLSFPMAHARFEGAAWDTLTSDTLRDASGQRTIRLANLFIIIGSVK